MSPSQSASEVPLQRPREIGCVKVHVTHLTTVIVGAYHVARIATTFNIQVETVNYGITKRTSIAVSVAKQLPHGLSELYALIVTGESVRTTCSAERQDDLFAFLLASLNI